MEQVHLEAKIKKPKLSDSFIRRQALLARLGESAGKLVILHATMGYGKTVLMNQYGSGYGDKQAWYHLTKTDNDIMLFLEYLAASVRLAVPEFSFSMEAEGKMEAGLLAGEDTFVKIGQDFAFALQKALKGGPFCLMLDDFQVIDSQQIYETLSAFLDVMPSGVRMFITTRGSMPQFALRLLLNGEALVLTDGELCFSRKEVQEVLMPLRGIQDREETAGIIYEYTGGWPAGVMFLYLYLRTWQGHVERENIQELCKKSMVHDFIMYEFFKKLSFELQRFLVKTSVLEYLQSSVCNVVAQVKNSESILNYLISEGIFIQKIENEVNTYRYHQLFKNFLLSQLGREDREELCQRAARYYLKTNEKEQAVEFAILSGDMGIVALALETTGEALLREGKLQLFKRWMDALCAQVPLVELSPLSLLMMAKYRYLTDAREEGLLLLHEAKKKALEAGAEGVFVRIFAEKAEWLLQDGEAAQVLGQCRREALERGKAGHRHWFLVKWLELRALLALGQEREAAVLSEKLSSSRERYASCESEEVREIRQKSQAVREALGTGKEACLSKLLQLGTRERMPQAWDILAAKWLADFCESLAAGSIFPKEQALIELALKFSESLKEARPISVYTAYGELVQGYLLFKGKHYREAVCHFQTAFQNLNPKQMAGWMAEGGALAELSRIFLAMEGGYLGKDHHCHLLFSFFGGLKVTVLETGDVVKWRTKKAQECIAFLAWNWQRGFSREELTGLLWDMDQPPSNEVAAFHNLLSSIRRSLSPFGLEELITYDGKQYSVKRKYLYTELGQAEGLLNLIEAEDGEMLSKKESFLERFSSHPYLLNFDSQWAREQREYYEVRFCRGFSILGNYYRESGQYKQAELMLNKAMKLAPYLEDAQEGLLLLYGYRKDLNGLAAVYEKIRGVWEKEVGTISGRLQSAYGEAVGMCQKK